MPSKESFIGSFSPAGALFAVTTFFYSAGEPPLRAQRRGSLLNQVTWISRRYAVLGAIGEVARTRVCGAQNTA